MIEHKNPLHTGSRGAGVVIDKGVTTTVKLSKKDKIEVKFNNKGDQNPSFITWKTIDLLRESFPFTGGLKICHKLEIPMGYGFGVSAACALGTVLGISRLLKLPLTFNRAVSIAHRVEVELGTGLGDVMGELGGGIVLRLKEGVPGYGITDKLIHEPLYVIAKVFGKLDTSSILSNPKIRGEINKTGKGMLKRLLLDPTPQRFMKLSLEFAKRTSLLTPKVADAIKTLKNETIGASMAMLGDTVFALSKTPDTSLNNPIIAKIDHLGVRFLD